MIPFTQWLFAYGPIVSAVAAYTWLGQVAARRFVRHFKGRLISAQQTVGKLKDTISSVEALTLVASAYLLIKGMDDYKKDLDARKKKENMPLETAV